MTDGDRKNAAQTVVRTACSSDIAVFCKTIVSLLGPDAPKADEFLAELFAACQCDLDEFPFQILLELDDHTEILEKLMSPTDFNSEDNYPLTSHRFF
jgi:hypothetical protein